MLFKLRRTSGAVLEVAALLLALTTSVLAQTLKIIDIPGAASTTPTAMSGDAGDIAGYFSLPAVGTVGFVRSPSGAVSSFNEIPLAINDAATTTGDGFIRDKLGNIKLISVPYNWGQGRYQFTTGKSIAIDDQGTIVGYYCIEFQCAYIGGYAVDAKGTVTTFPITKPDGFAYGGIPTSMNARGDVAGYGSVIWIEDGFIRLRSGAVTHFTVPQSAGFGPGGRPLSINNRGDVAGYYGVGNCANLFPAPSPFCQLHAFIRDSLGNFTTFDAMPGAVATKCISINDSGDVAGEVIDAAGGVHGFIRTSPGALTIFDPPNASSVRVVSINNRDDVIGTYTDSGGVAHAFLFSVR